MRIPRKVVLIGATAAMLALIPASSASAYSAGEKKAEKKQNARAKKLSADLTALKKLVETVNGSIPGLSGGTAKIDAGATKTDAVDGRLKVIEGAAPQIIQGLADLKTGLETAGAGLNGLKTAVGSTEYGVGQVFNGATPIPGAFLVTSDIPDAVQQAQ